MLGARPPPPLSWLPQGTPIRGLCFYLLSHSFSSPFPVKKMEWEQVNIGLLQEEQNLRWGLDF